MLVLVGKEVVEGNEMALLLELEMVVDLVQNGSLDLGYDLHVHYLCVHRVLVCNCGRLGYNYFVKILGIAAVFVVLGVVVHDLHSRLCVVMCCSCSRVDLLDSECCDE